MTIELCIKACFEIVRLSEFFFFFFGHAQVTIWNTPEPKLQKNTPEPKLKNLEHT